MKLLRQITAQLSNILSCLRRLEVIISADVCELPHQPNEHG